MDVEEDGPLEDWTVKELKEECKTLGLSDKGKKVELIERIRAAKAVTTEAVIEKSVEEVAVEEAAVEEPAVEEPAIEETPVEEPSVETAADEKEADVMDVEEDSPLENWTVKELKEECKTLGLTDKGKKADLIERIREAQGKKSEATPVVEEIA